MTEEELKERVADLSPKVAGKKAKGLDVEGFDSFLDEMVGLPVDIFAPVDILTFLFVLLAFVLRWSCSRRRTQRRKMSWKKSTKLLTQWHRVVWVKMTTYGGIVTMQERRTKKPKDLPEDARYFCV